MKILCTLFAVLMLLISTAFCFAQADQPEEIITYSSGDWDYIENETGITLTVYRGNETDLEIPSELDEKPVTKLEKSLFSNNKGLTAVFWLYLVGKC